MRKKPEPKTRICELCGQEYQSSATVSHFCRPCAEKHEKERKREWARVKYGYTPKVKHTDPCCICGGPFSCFYDGKPYCNKHWLRMYLHGTPDKLMRQTTNKYVDHGDYVSIFTKKGEEILVDKYDFDKVKKFSWCISKTGYCVANVGNGRVQKIHRYILDLTDPNQVVDHINHNPFDNRRQNLRICTAKENSYNQRGNSNRDLPIGIRYTNSDKYQASIYVDGKTINLGRYDLLDDAVAARKKAELEYRGEFAYQANPDFMNMPQMEVQTEQRIKIPFTFVNIEK